MRFFGCHVSAAGGIFNAALHAETLGINSIQLHASPPQRWISKPFPAEAAERFNAERKAGLKKVFFHALYLINLATPNDDHFKLSMNSLQYYLELNGQLSGDGVVVHVGSAKDQPDERSGYVRAAEGINRVLDKAAGDAQLLLEVAAGSGAVIGDRFEDLAEIFEMIENKDRVGFALDTQHMWASGYDLADGLDDVVKEADKNFSLKKIKVIHLNDSKTEKGSRKDRHENLGKGLIGVDAMKRFVNHPKLKSIPLILETPAMKTLETAAEETDVLRKLLD